ncbi:MAG: TfoX/Sxy family protein [Myxococcales bacterium]
MSKFEKASPETKALFASLIEGLACEPRPMFGCPSAFVNGQLFTSLFGSTTLIVRLDERQRAKLLELDGTQPFDPMGGRPMKEYVQILSLEDEELLAVWVKRAFAYAQTLPPKTKAKAKSRPKPTLKKAAKARKRG